MKRAPGHGRRTGAGWLALLVILLQTLSGPPAMAARYDVIEICSAHGKRIMVVEQPADQTPNAPCAHCDHCVLTAVAAAPATVSAGESVRYAVAAIARATTPTTVVYAARGPPRPFGQAPPTFLN